MERYMNTYLLRKPTETCDVIDLDIVEMTNQIIDKTGQSFDEILEVVMDDIPRGKKTLLELSEHGFVCKHEPRAKKQNYDVNLYGCFLVLNRRAYNCLNEAIINCGEFVPLKTDSEEMFLFNTLNFASEDLTLTEKAYLDGYEDGLKTLVFDINDIQDKLLFKSKLQGGLSVYCTDDFKKLITDNNLSGINFNKDLLSCF
ncbi:hypothetical protein [Pseudoalteromonas prydzensis]|uniref:hypothetical protein n=2 Tax=Pseudoalteromonas prydzensis TaxID=182141 RepID=UPI00186B80E4|nr:hypothetical protein [Pseudoalteromonas prydzensis]MBE0377676.1 hypothetical protein [Pseudoalteromonas prydzensis ACAM 620]